MSHGRSAAGYDPRAFAHPSSRQSSISNQHSVIYNCTIVHALRHQNQDRFLFLLETFEEKTYSAIEVSFPKSPDTGISSYETVAMQPRLPEVVCPIISAYLKSNILEVIREFKRFTSYFVTSEESSDLLKLFSEFKRGNFAYNLNSSTREEQLKVLHSILEPLYKIVPLLKVGISQFPEVEKRSRCTIS